MSQKPARLALEVLDVPGTTPVVLTPTDPPGEAPWVRDGLRPTIGSMFPGGPPPAQPIVVIHLQVTAIVANPGGDVQVAYLFNGRFLASPDVFRGEDDARGDIITGPDDIE